MKSVLRLVSLAFLVCIILPDVAWCVQLANGDPTRFRYATSPQLPVFAPGNTGRFVLETTPTRNVGILPNEERQMDGHVVELFNSTYNFSPVGNDAESTRPAGYWLRLGHSIADAAQYGAMTDCRVTSALLAELATHEITADQYATRFAAMLSNVGKCLVTVDIAREDDAFQFEAAFHSAAPTLLIGRVCTSLDELQSARKFDFVVVNETIVPESYRGQAAISYCHSRAGDIPIIMQSMRPQMHKELFWLAAGAAGIQYSTDFLAPDMQNRTIAWRNIRAVASIPRRFGGRFRIAGEIMQTGLFGALMSPENTMFALLPLRNARLDVPLPAAPPDRPESVGVWYNPVTDENIVLPRTVSPQSGRVRLTTPSGDPWIYLHAFLPKAADNETTTALILPEPPEPPDNFDQETSSSR